ncbi:MAG: sodium:solute symporter family protein [Planctomycetota bacterium]|nr:sodium:solute symporter family protein [Planctomycetota bacterium]
MTQDRLIELGMLTAYLGVLMWIGIRSARRVRTSADYTLAGRSVPWVVILATTAATMIGGGASVGMVSKVAEIGIAAAVVTCAWHLQLLLTGVFIAPRLRGLNLITVGDYFDLKFGPMARELAVVNCTIFLIGALAAQMAAMGTVTNAVLGLDYTTALVIGAAVTVFYSTVGGIPAVVKTDVMQFVILVIGIGTAAALPMAESAQAGQFDLTSHWSSTRLISLFIAFLLGETLVPPYAVRCFIAKDQQAARRGVAGAGLFLLLFLPIATFTLGTATQISPEVQEALAAKKRQIIEDGVARGETIAEKDAASQAQRIAFPTLIRSTFHPILSGLIIAAVIAAVMSSADSCLSCLSTVVMEDVYRRHLRPNASDRQLLRVAQVTTFVTGIAAAVCAWFVRDIAALLEFVYDFWAPTMILPFLVGIFWYRKTRIHAVVMSMLTGIVTVVVWRFVLDSPYDIGPAMAGIVVATLAYLVASACLNREPGHRLFLPSEGLDRDGVGMSGTSGEVDS